MFVYRPYRSGFIDADVNEADVQDNVVKDFVADVRFKRSVLTRYALSYQESPKRALIDECKSISMLHQETLGLLNYIAGCVQGAVLEIGPYIGGSTIAIGAGLKEGSGGPHIVIEVGGAHPHPEYPTTDILADLKRNIRKHNLTNLVLLEGWSYDPAILRGARETLGAKKVDLLFIDADGSIERDWELYEPFLSDGCLIALDDYLYTVSGPDSKQMGVRSWVCQAIEDGMVEDLGVFLWGTWFGRYIKKG